MLIVFAGLGARLWIASGWPTIRPEGAGRERHLYVQRVISPLERRSYDVKSPSGRVEQDMQTCSLSLIRGGLITVLFGWPFPLNELQIENKNAIENGHEQQGNEGSHAKPANLRITKRFPQRATVQCKRKKS